MIAPSFLSYKMRHIGMVSIIVNFQTSIVTSLPSLPYVYSGQTKVFAHHKTHVY